MAQRGAGEVARAPGLYDSAAIVSADVNQQEPTSRQYLMS
jgi:hypothetical protein